MFTRFTEQARRVVVLAREEASTLRHNCVGTEHILLGLLREEGGIGALVLERLDISAGRVRAEVVRTVGVGEAAVTQIPFTSRAKQALECELREALVLGHNYIGTEHILLGVVGDDEALATRILIGCNADREQIHGAVIEMLSGPERSDQGAG